MSPPFPTIRHVSISTSTLNLYFDSKINKLWLRSFSVYFIKQSINQCKYYVVYSFCKKQNSMRWLSTYIYKTISALNIIFKKAREGQKIGSNYYKISHHTIYGTFERIVIYCISFLGRSFANRLISDLLLPLNL